MQTFRFYFSEKLTQEIIKQYIDEITTLLKVDLKDPTIGELRLNTNYYELELEENVDGSFRSCLAIKQQKKKKSTLKYLKDGVEITLAKTKTINQTEKITTFYDKGFEECRTMLKSNEISTAPSKPASSEVAFAAGKEDKKDKKTESNLNLKSLSLEETIVKKNFRFHFEHLQVGVVGTANSNEVMRLDKSAAQQIIKNFIKNLLKYADENAKIAVKEEADYCELELEYSVKRRYSLQRSLSSPIKTEMSNNYPTKLQIRESSDEGDESVKELGYEEGDEFISLAKQTTSILTLNFPNMADYQSRFSNTPVPVKTNGKNSPTALQQPEQDASAEGKLSSTNGSDINESLAEAKSNNTNNGHGTQDKTTEKISAEVSLPPELQREDLSKTEEISSDGVRKEGDSLPKSVTKRSTSIKLRHKPPELSSDNVASSLNDFNLDLSRLPEQKNDNFESVTTVTSNSDGYQTPRGEINAEQGKAVSFSEQTLTSEPQAILEEEADNNNNLAESPSVLADNQKSSAERKVATQKTITNWFTNKSTIPSKTIQMRLIEERANDQPLSSPTTDHFAETTNENVFAKADNLLESPIPLKTFSATHPGQYNYTIHSQTTENPTGLTKEEIRTLVENLRVPKDKYTDDLDSNSTLTIHLDSNQQLGLYKNSRLEILDHDLKLYRRSQRTGKHGYSPLFDNGGCSYTGKKSYLQKKEPKAENGSPANDKQPVQTTFETQPAPISGVNTFLHNYHTMRDLNTHKYYGLGFTLFGYSGKDKLEAVERLSKGETLSKRDVAILNQGSLGRQLKAKITEVYPDCKHNRINKLLVEVGYVQQENGSYELGSGLKQAKGLERIEGHTHHNNYGGKKR